MSERGGAGRASPKQILGHPLPNRTHGVRNRGMEINRTFVRRAALSLAGVVFTIVVVAPLSQFSISLAEEHAWYQNPSAKVRAVITFFAAITDNHWFHWIGGTIIGFAFGVWLDAILKRRDDSSSKKAISISKSDLILIEELRAFFHSWITPAAHEVHNAIHFLASRMGQEHIALAGQVGNLAYQAIVDPERAAFSILSNKLNGIDCSQSDLLTVVADYYRRYQACRTWIAQFAENLNIDVKSHHATHAWLARDQAFLHELRRLCGQSGFQRLREQIDPVGWGEGITLRLNENRSN